MILLTNVAKLNFYVKTLNLTRALITLNLLLLTLFVSFNSNNTVKAQSPVPYEERILTTLNPNFENDDDNKEDLTQRPPVSAYPGYGLDGDNYNFGNERDEEDLEYKITGVIPVRGNHYPGAIGWSHLKRDEKESGIVYLFTWSPTRIWISRLVTGGSDRTESGGETTSLTELRYELLLTQEIGNVHQIKGYILHDRIYLTIIRVELPGVDSISASYLCHFEPGPLDYSNRYSNLGMAKLTIIQSLPTHGRSHLELFSYKGENFMALTNLEITEGGDKHKIEFVIYKWDHAHMDVFVTRECTNALRNKVFNIDGSFYLFVLQEKGKDGEANIGSPLFVVDFDLRRTRMIQVLETHRPSDVSYIERNNVHYLVIANTKDSGGRIDVWGWMYGQQFVKYQSITMPAPILQIHHFATPNAKIGLLVLENGGRDGRYNSTLRILIEDNPRDAYDTDNTNFGNFIDQGCLKSTLLAPSQPTTDYETPANESTHKDRAELAELLEHFSQLSYIDLIQNGQGIFVTLTYKHDGQHQSVASSSLNQQFSTMAGSLEDKLDLTSTSIPDIGAEDEFTNTSFAQLSESTTAKPQGGSYGGGGPNNKRYTIIKIELSRVKRSPIPSPDSLVGQFRALFENLQSTLSRASLMNFELGTILQVEAPQNITKDVELNGNLIVDGNIKIENLYLRTSRSEFPQIDMEELTDLTDSTENMTAYYSDVLLTNQPDQTLNGFFEFLEGRNFTVTDEIVCPDITVSRDVNGIFVEQLVSQCLSRNPPKIISPSSSNGDYDVREVPNSYENSNYASPTATNSDLINPNIVTGEWVIPMDKIVQASSVTYTGTLNDQTPLLASTLDPVLIFEEVHFTSGLHIKGHVRLEGTLNGLDDFSPANMEYNDQTITIRAKKTINGNLRLTGQFDYAEDLNKRINLPKWRDESYLTLTGDQTVHTPIVFDAPVQFDNVEFRGLVNELDIQKLVDNVVLPGEGYQTITGPKHFHGDMEIQNNAAFRGTLNGHDLSRDLIVITENPSIFTMYNFVMVDTVTVEEHVEIELLNGKKFSDDVFTGNTEQEITGKWTFANDVEFMGTTQIDEYKNAIYAEPGVKINGYDLSDTIPRLVKKRGYNRFREEVTFDVPLTQIEGNVTTEYGISINGHHLPDLTEVWTLATDQVIPIQNLNGVQAEIVVKERLLASKINGFDIPKDFVLLTNPQNAGQPGSNQYLDSVVDDENSVPTQTIRSKVVFESPENLKDPNVDGALRMERLIFNGNAKLNDIQPNDYLNKVIYIDTDEGTFITINGDVTFKRDVIFNNKINITKTLNGLDLYRDLLLNGSAQELTVSNLAPGLLVIVGNLIVRGSVNILTPESTIIQGRDIEAFCNAIVHPSNPSLDLKNPNFQPITGIKVFTQEVRAESLQITGRIDDVTPGEFQDFIHKSIHIDPTSREITIKKTPNLTFAGLLKSEPAKEHHKHSLAGKFSTQINGDLIKPITITTGPEYRREFKDLSNYLANVVRAHKGEHAGHLIIKSPKNQAQSAVIVLSGRKYFNGTQPTTFARGLNLIDRESTLNGVNFDHLGDSFLDRRHKQNVASTLNFENGLTIDELLIPPPADLPAGRKIQIFGHAYEDLYKLDNSKIDKSTDPPSLTIHEDVTFEEELECVTERVEIQDTLNGINFNEIINKLESTPNLLIFNKDQEFDELFVYGNLSTVGGVNGRPFTDLPTGHLLQDEEQVIEADLHFENEVTFRSGVAFESGLNGRNFKDWLGNAMQSNSQEPQVIQGDLQIGNYHNRNQHHAYPETEVVVKHNLVIDTLEDGLQHPKRHPEYTPEYFGGSDNIENYIERNIKMTPQISLNGFHISRRLLEQAVHRNPPENRPVVIRNKISYSPPDALTHTVFEKNLRLDGAINGVYFPANFIPIHEGNYVNGGDNPDEPIYIPGHVIIQNTPGVWSAKDILIEPEGTLNGIDIKEFSDSLFNHRHNEMDLKGHVTFRGNVNVKGNVNFASTLNAIRPAHDLVFKDEPSNIAGHKVIKDVDLKINGDITSEDETCLANGINGIDVRQLSTNLVKRGSDVDLKHQITFAKPVIIDQNITVKGRVNGHIIKELEVFFETSIEKFEGDMTVLKSDIKTHDAILDSQINASLEQPSQLSFWEVSHTWPVLTETFRYDFLRYYDSHFIYKWIHNASGCPGLPNECRCDQMELLELSKDGKLGDPEILGHFRDFPMTIDLAKYETRQNIYALYGKPSKTTIPKSSDDQSSAEHENVQHEKEEGEIDSVNESSGTELAVATETPISDVMIVVSTRSISYKKSCMVPKPAPPPSHHNREYEYQADYMGVREKTATSFYPTPIQEAAYYPASSDHYNRSNSPSAPDQQTYHPKPRVYKRDTHRSSNYHKDSPDENTHVYLLGNLEKLKAYKTRHSPSSVGTADLSDVGEAKSFIRKSSKILSTYFVSDAVYFYRHRQLYIVILNYFDKHTESHNIDSYVYKFDYANEDWELVQSIPTLGAISGTVFTSTRYLASADKGYSESKKYGNSLYLAIANNYDTIQATHSVHSFIYEWDDVAHQFYPITSVHTETARDVISITINGIGYVVFANEKASKSAESLTDDLYQEPVTVFHHDPKSDSFVRVQDHYIPGVVKLDTFVINGDYYLTAVSFVQNKLVIFKWHEYTYFTVESEIPIEGARSAHAFWDRGQLYMALGTLGSYDKLLVAKIKGNKNKDNIKALSTKYPQHGTQIHSKYPELYNIHVPHWVQSYDEATNSSLTPSNADLASDEREDKFKRQDGLIKYIHGQEEPLDSQEHHKDDSNEEKPSTTAIYEDSHAPSTTISHEVQDNLTTLSTYPSQDMDKTVNPIASTEASSTLAGNVSAESISIASSTAASPKAEDTTFTPIITNLTVRPSFSVTTPDGIDGGQHIETTTSLQIAHGADLGATSAPDADELLSSLSSLLSTSNISSITATTPKVHRGNQSVLSPEKEDEFNVTVTPLLPGEPLVTQPDPDLAQISGGEPLLDNVASQNLTSAQPQTATSLSGSGINSTLEPLDKSSDDKSLSADTISQVAASLDTTLSSSIAPQTTLNEDALLDSDNATVTPSLDGSDDKPLPAQRSKGNHTIIPLPEMTIGPNGDVDQGDVSTETTRQDSDTQNTTFILTTLSSPPSLDLTSPSSNESSHPANDLSIDKIVETTLPHVANDATIAKSINDHSPTDQNSSPVMSSVTPPADTTPVIAKPVDSVEQSTPDTNLVPVVSNKTPIAETTPLINESEPNASTLTPPLIADAHIDPTTPLNIAGILPDLLNKTGMLGEDLNLTDFNFINQTGEHLKKFLPKNMSQSEVDDLIKGIEEELVYDYQHLHTTSGTSTIVVTPKGDAQKPSVNTPLASSPEPTSANTVAANEEVHINSSTPTNIPINTTLPNDAHTTNLGQPVEDTQVLPWGAVEEESTSNLPAGEEATETTRRWRTPPNLPPMSGRGRFSRRNRSPTFSRNRNGNGQNNAPHYI